MAAEGEGVGIVYRVSTSREWEQLQKNGFTFGGDLDRTTGCIHLSRLSQVKGVLKNFFQGREDLYLLEIDAAMLGEGLIYESADNINFFPHLYGPARSFIPLKLEAVTKAEKLQMAGCIDTPLPDMSDFIFAGQVTESSGSKDLEEFIDCEETTNEVIVLA